MGLALNKNHQSVFRLFLINSLMRKSTQFTLLVSLTLLGIFSTLGYQNFLYLQAQNISQLSVYNQVFKPLSGLVLLTEIISASVVASQLIPYWFERGQQGLIINASIKASHLVSSSLMAIFVVSLIPLFYFGLIGLTYLSVSPIDSALLISNSMGLLLGCLLIGTLILSVSLLTRRTLVSFAICTVIALGALALDEVARSSGSLNSFSIYLDLFIHLREGLVLPVEILRWFFWLVFFYCGCLLALQKLQNNVKRLTLLMALASICLLVVIGIVIKNVGVSNSYATSHVWRWDISQAKNNSLDIAAINQITKISKPIKIIAVVNKEENHDEIKKGFDVIKQYQPNSILEFSDRQSDNNKSKLAEQYVSIEIGEHRQSIRYPFDKNVKDTFVELILQLTTRSDQWITFIEGHGEASPFSKTNRDVSQFYQSIKNLGWPVAAQNLITQPRISRNTKILIIAASQRDWLPKETESVIRYLQEGGNLLLLREQNDRLPYKLLSYLGISTEIGVLIDWQGYQSGTPHPAILIVNQFSNHPINTGINSLLAFPWSSALLLDEKAKSPNREYQKILETHTGVWTEFDADKEDLSYNPDIGELRQPFPIGYSIVDKRLHQRIVVMGDSSFVSDSAINNYANRQFSLNIISWLASQKTESIDRPYDDSYIKASPIIHFVLRWLFSAILPLILALIFILPRVKFKRMN